MTSFAKSAVHLIARFFLRIDAPMISSCKDGSMAGAIRYVERLLKYHKNDPKLAAGLKASTLVYERERDELVAVCLLGGGGGDGKSCGIYDIEVDPVLRGRGLGTLMIKRAMTILAEEGVPEIHLWRNDGERAETLYERLGFTPTGRVEE